MKWNSAAALSVLALVATMACSRAPDLQWPVEETRWGPLRFGTAQNRAPTPASRTARGAYES
jgi:hypothetical protein